jgi:beta-glucosidase
MKMQDGPQGFRSTDRTGGSGSSTAWPSTQTIGASWDTDLAYRWAYAMGEEFRAKGANMHLGPGIGIGKKILWFSSFILYFLIYLCLF